MNIVVKHFYFIKDEFYKFVEDPLLMENKENGNKRPCFLAIKDDKNIIWLIPVTSKYEKFKNRIKLTDPLLKHRLLERIGNNKFYNTYNNLQT